MAPTEPLSTVHEHSHSSLSPTAWTCRPIHRHWRDKVKEYVCDAGELRAEGGEARGGSEVVEAKAAAGEAQADFVLR